MKAEEIKKVACIGGGVIGSGWAIQFAMHGLETTLYDVNEAMLERARAQMAQSLDVLVEHDAISASRRAELLAGVRFTCDLGEAVEGAQFLQESGPERLEVKRSILAEVERRVSPEAIFASSTSGLLISDIAAEAVHPERCIGAHPFNPPHLIPLVELIRGERTGDEVLETAYAFFQSIGKEAVLLQKECPGFIANRLQLALFREAQELVCRGICSVEDVDKALVYGPGLRWAIFGHHMIMQLGNPGGFTAMRKSLGTGADVWLADMANWTRQPENYAELAQPGIDREMANFPDEIGHTNADCAAYRDKMLIELLKLHGKL